MYTTNKQTIFVHSSGVGLVEEGLLLVTGCVLCGDQGTAEFL